MRPGVRVGTTEPELYVGYRTLPQGARRVVVLVAAALVLVFAGLSAAFAIVQRPAGNGTWTIDRVGAWSGVLVAEPYPMLLVGKGHDSGGESGAYLLVGEGKVGVQERVDAIRAQRPGAMLAVTVRGTMIERDNRRLIEVASGAEGFRVDPREVDAAAVERAFNADNADAGATPGTAVSADIGRPLSIRAEIVDGKCYLGAMKPGDGKGHKACATLCVLGGLPALIVELKGPGSKFVCPPTSIALGEVHPLLIVDGSTRIDGPVLELIGEPVLIQGVMKRRWGMPVIEARSQDIRRAGRLGRRSPWRTSVACELRASRGESDQEQHADLHLVRARVWRAWRS